MILDTGGCSKDLQFFATIVSQLCSMTSALPYHPWVDPRGAAMHLLGKDSRLAVLLHCMVGSALHWLHLGAFQGYCPSDPLSSPRGALAGSCPILLSNRTSTFLISFPVKGRSLGLCFALMAVA